MTTLIPTFVTKGSKQPQWNEHRAIDKVILRPGFLLFLPTLNQINYTFQLDRSLVEALVQQYRLDFEMFDYDPKMFLNLDKE